MALFKSNKGAKKDFTNMKTPHTYAIIFFVVLFCWILTFLVPAGKFSTQTVEYTDSNGSVKTKNVLDASTFRYSYNLDTAAIEEHLEALIKDEAKLEALEVEKESLETFLATDSAEWTQADLDEIGLTDDELFAEFGITALILRFKQFLPARFVRFQRFFFRIKPCITQRKNCITVLITRVHFRGNYREITSIFIYSRESGSIAAS